MEQEELRKEYFKYCIRPTFKEKKEVLGLFANLLFKLVRDHHTEDLADNMDARAKVIVQMILSKSLYIQKLLDGVSFTTDDGTTLHELQDPMTLAVLVRNLYETISMFHLIYRAPNSEDEKIIVYQLWVIAGLSYRQRFESNITLAANRNKFEDEQKEIQDSVALIESNPLFTALDQKNKDKIKNRIKQKEYLVRFDSHQNAVFLTWHDMIKVMGIRPGIFDNLYTYFSLYSHPSYVSVFQFGQLFNGVADDAAGLAGFNTEYVLFLLSIFLADFIHLFPLTKTSFEKMPALHQLILNHHNKLARGDAFSINDSWKALG